MSELLNNHYGYCFTSEDFNKKVILSCRNLRGYSINHNLSRNLKPQAIICAVNTWLMQIIILYVLNLVDMEFLIKKTTK